MKAIAVDPSRKSIGIVEHAPPTMTTPTSVRLKVLEVGVCGTDKEICAFEYGTPPEGSDYLVLGHESLGEVLEVGPEVSRVRPGDLVVPMVRRPCHHESCPACRVGRQDFCLTGDFTERGIKEQHGFMTEQAVDEERYMNVVPHSLREVAVLVEPLTIAEKALLQLWDVQERLPWGPPGQQGGSRHRAVVLGAGPVGLLGAMALSARGFETYVYSRSQAPNDKSELCEAMGVQYISSEEHTPEQMAAKVGNIDLVYEGVGASKISFDVLRVLGTNGVFVFTGVPGRKAPIQLDSDLLMRNLVLKNQLVFGTVNAGKDAFEAAVADLEVFLRRWPAAVRKLITGRYPLEEHRDLLLGKAGGIKNVLVLPQDR